MAEGAPLLREYGVNSFIEGSNPSFSAIHKSPSLTTGAFFMLAFWGFGHSVVVGRAKTLLMR